MLFLLFQLFLGWGGLVRYGSLVDARLRLVALVEQAVKLVGLEDVVHGLVDDILDEGLSVAQVRAKMHFGLNIGVRILDYK